MVTNLMVKKTLIVYNDEGKSQFTSNMPTSHSAHLVTRVEHSQMNEVTERVVTWGND